MTTCIAVQSACCPECGSLLDASLPGFLCVRCLLGLALEPVSNVIEDNLLDFSLESGIEACPGGVVGRYRLLGEIDRGGVGIVYRVWQADLKREVALKMLLPSRLETEDSLERFRREAELMAGLDHPGILPVYEVGTQDGLPYFSMKLAEGGNLAQRIAPLHGQFRECAQLVARIARAIGYAHSRGVLHRDLKPSNIVFDAAEQPLVTDFGLARSLERDSSLTGVDALIGTPRYVAPEVITAAGAHLTAAADVYGLGAILYELLSGQAPFAELTPVQILRQIAKHRPHPPRKYNATIPVALETICLRCLEKRPQDRYSSAYALADALETWLANDQPARFPRLALKLGLPSQRRRMKWTAALLLVAVLGATGSYYVLREPIPIPDPTLATRTVTVLPLDPEQASSAEREASRQLAKRLRLPSQMKVLPFDATLRSASARRFPRHSGDADAKLGAFLRVNVAAVPGTQRFTVRARDVLRNERLYETTFALFEVDKVAHGLSRALAQRRRRPPPEARLSRRALASLLRADRLLNASAPSERDNDAAIAAIKDMIVQAPDSALAHARLATAYGRRNGETFWLDSAIDEAARAQRMDPTLAMAPMQLGRAYYFKSWFTRAVAAYEQARAMGDPDADYWLALLYAQQGRFDDSYRLYREVRSFAPDARWPQILIAHLLFTVGDIGAGERTMRAVIAQASSPESRTMKEAEIALYRRDPARCHALAASLEPETYDGIFTASEMLRTCAVLQGDFVAALASVEASARAYASEKGSANGNPPGLAEAILLAQLHRPQKVPTLLKQARQGLQAAIDSGSEYPPVWLRMAAAQRLAGEVDAAYATLERAFALGLTFNNRNRSDLEFLPFLGDARFAVLRAKSEAYVAAQRKKIAAQDPATASL